MDKSPENLQQYGKYGLTLLQLMAALGLLGLVIAWVLSWFI